MRGDVVLAAPGVPGVEHLDDIDLAGRSVGQFEGQHGHEVSVPGDGLEADELFGAGVAHTTCIQEVCRKVDVPRARMGTMHDTQQQRRPGPRAALRRPPRLRRQPHRHRPGVVRLRHLLRRRGPGLRRSLLPVGGPAHRHAAGVLHLRGRLRLPPARRLRLRPARRRDRPQEGADRHPCPDRRRDLADRSAAAYATIGVAAPIVLVVLRFAQGVGVGGEWGGAVLLSSEFGDPRRRGFYASAAQIGPPAGQPAGQRCARRPRRTAHRGRSSCPGAGAWRSCCPASWSAFGLWIRAKLEETPVFKAMEAEQSRPEAPIREVFTHPAPRPGRRDPVPRRPRRAVRACSPSSC